jgi:ABC-type transporter Mla subunit MlaD
VPAGSTADGGLPRLLLTAAVVAIALVALILATSSSGPPHRLFVTVPDATDAIAGQDIRAAGQNVGQIDSIEPVDRGRAVRIELGIDGTEWPLPSGTRFALHWGGTISYDNRYLELTRGPANAQPLAEGQTLPAADFSVPVEFDQLLGTFTPAVRGDLKAFLDRAGVALHVAEPDLRAAIGQAPPALTQASDVLQDLDANEAALNALVISSDHVVGAVQTAEPGVGQLISGAAATFGAVASQASALQSTLSATPATLIDARMTLGHADRTLTAAGSLLGHLAPGVAQARLLAPPLDNLLETLTQVGPNAISTLATARSATAQVNPLLVKATSLMPELGSIGKQAINELDCIRPYTPDIIAFFTNWGDWLSYTDGKDRYGQANVESLLPAASNTETETSAQAAAAFPGLEYGFPRPPGYDAGQPWFLPQCGAGPNALNPADDPESKPYNLLEQIPGLSSLGGAG